MGVHQRKRRTLSKTTKSSQAEDRISNLPDELLGRILSLLPTNHAVATSILSSRWKNVYKLITTLDFDDSTSSYPRDDLGDTHRTKATSFKRFLNEVLGQCNMYCITKFRLRCGCYQYKNSLLCNWINYGAASFHKVTELELSIDEGYTLRVPCVLKLSRLNCENLVVLKLDCGFILCITKSFTFPNLKVLFLKGITVSGSNSARFSSVNDHDHDHGLNGILFGCPLLEKLVINGCDWNGGDLYFDNPLLRRLTLDSGVTGCLDQLNGSTIHFNLPSLVYLNLSNKCLKAITSGDFELPIFRNLTRLDLALGHDVSWNDVLLDFLNSSPSIEYLTLEQGFLRCTYSLQDGGDFLLNGEVDDGFLLTEEVVPMCVHSRLKVINIKKFRGLVGEMQMIMYFLKNAHLLEEMIIHWDQRVTKRDPVAIMKEILELPKSSISCSIAFK